MAGIIGTMGIPGRPEVLIFGVTCWGGAVEDGVVGWVERASEGGCEDDGVSRFKG